MTDNLNLPEEFRKLLVYENDKNPVGLSGYELKSILTALSDTRDEIDRLKKGISNLFAITPCECDIPYMATCKFCKIFSELEK